MMMMQFHTQRIFAVEEETRGILDQTGELICAQDDSYLIDQE